MPKRNITPAKSAKSAKPVAKPVANVAATSAKPAVATVAKPTVPAHVRRTVATIVRGACNYGGTLSERDSAYFTFYKRLAQANGGKLTVAAIVESGQRPAYNGSNKPHDAGAVQRLVKAGLLAGSGADDKPLTITAAGSSHK